VKLFYWILYYCKNFGSVILLFQFFTNYQKVSFIYKHLLLRQSMMIHYFLHDLIVKFKKNALSTGWSFLELTANNPT